MTKAQVRQAAPRTSEPRLLREPRTQPVRLLIDEDGLRMLARYLAKSIRVVAGVPAADAPAGPFPGPHPRGAPSAVAVLAHAGALWARPRPGRPHARKPPPRLKVVGRPVR